MRHLLLIAHPFAPSGGAGVYRPVKFARYLADHGWRPTVLTVRDGYYLLRDETLMAGLRPPVRIIRTNSLEPRPRTVLEWQGVDRQGPSIKRRAIRALYDSFVIPDRSLLWLPHAFAAALRAATLDPPDAMLATGNPYSSFLLAALLGQTLRRPYVLDYQDPWTLNPYSQQFSRGSNPWRAAVERTQERLVLKRCSAAVFVSDQVRDDHVAVHPDLADRFHVIPNGYDPEDVARSRPLRVEGFSLVYTGKFTHYRRPDNFLRGLAIARGRDAAFGAAARAVFVGDWAPEHQTLADSLGLGDAVVPLGYRPHAESIGYQRGASALALISGTDRTEQTGKVFEFLVADRPILAPVLRGGAVEDVLRHTGGAYFCDPDDPQSIARAILEIWSEGPNARRPDPVARQRYDRRALAGDLADVLNRVTRDG